MKRRFVQWSLISAGAGSLVLVGLLIFPKLSIALVEPLLEPWLAICRALTPEAWQVQGNILLGMGWMISGVALYSLLAGAVAVAAWAFVDRRRRRHAQSFTHSLPSSDE
jgi:hypothetical protein